MYAPFGDIAAPVTETGMSPFRRQGLLVRVLPFAVIAIAAEASIALPPGPLDWPPLMISLILLALVAAAFWLPWERLPGWLAVVVPLAYVGSAVGLSLAAGPASGVGIVILAAVVWAALFHQPLETACVVVAVIGAEWAVTVVQGAPGVVTMRRVLLWALLASVIAVAGHGLRSRIRRSLRLGARLEQELRALSVARDRERIAAGLQEQVAARLLAATSSLQGAAGLSRDPAVSQRVTGSIGELDEAARLLRDAIFGLTGPQAVPGPRQPGLRQRVLHTCATLSPAPVVSLRGNLDEKLPAAAGNELVDVLRGALSQVAATGSVCDLAIDADDGVVMTMICRSPWTEGQHEGAIAALAGRAALAGVSFSAAQAPPGLRLTWRFPANPH